jgi:hypothetical protein
MRHANLTGEVPRIGDDCTIDRKVRSSRTLHPSDGRSAMRDVEVGCLWLTLFGSSRCFAGFTNAPMGFGCSRVTGFTRCV